MLLRTSIKITHNLYRLKTNLKLFLISLLYSPLYEDKTAPEDNKFLFKVYQDEISYFVAIIANGRIYTDRNILIAIMSKRSLLSCVSWQYDISKLEMVDSESRPAINNLQLSELPCRISGTVISLLTGHGGNYNYYHWLFDSLPRIKLAHAKIKRDSSTKYYIPEDTKPFQIESLTELGIPAASRISSLNKRHLKADLLVVTEHPNPVSSRLPPWIVKFLRDSFLKYPVCNNYGDFIYISRDDSSNARILLNEELFLNRLSSWGFRSYQLSNLSFRNQVDLFATAKILVGVHGAGLANLAFTSPGTYVFELFGSDYQPNMYEQVSLINGVLYTKIICRSIPSSSHPRHDNLYISDISIDVIKEAVQAINRDNSFAP